MSSEKYWNVAKKEKLCFRCLVVHEDKLAYKKENRCKKCLKPHSTWLHSYHSKKENLVLRDWEIQRVKQWNVLGSWKEDVPETDTSFNIFHKKMVNNKYQSRTVTFAVLPTTTSPFKSIVVSPVMTNKIVMARDNVHLGHEKNCTNSLE